ncbi:MAG: hypothetical protein K0U24_08740 [Gammaproteobacteria bacterium]|nr:hypothetical protein [Gammaproteobacteria bacterium]
MGYGFFNNKNTHIEATFSPTIIKLSDRPDVAVALFLLNQYLANKNLPNRSSVKAVFRDLNFVSHTEDLSSPEKIAECINLLANKIKTGVLSAPITPCSNASTWFIDTASHTMGLNINIAEEENNKTLRAKQDGSRDASFVLRQQNNQISYLVPVQSSCFMHLNTNGSYPTNTALDDRCDERKQACITLFNEENADLEPAIRLEAKKIATDSTIEEMQQAYIRTVNQALVSPIASIPHDSYQNALANAIASDTVSYQNKTQSSFSAQP